jgi:uroporphyrinogen-III synthase
MPGKKSKETKKATKKVIKSTLKAQPAIVSGIVNGALKTGDKPGLKTVAVKKTTTKKQMADTSEEKNVSLNSGNHEPAAKNPVKRNRKSLKKPSPAIILPEIEISNHPKLKVRSILVSQPKPPETEKNPYFDLARKYNLTITFRQFLKVEGLSAQEFRAQRVDILEHGAVILTSKLAVDHYFRICNEMRVTVPESMKYFCINEQTAYYLQKYIQYRKRKIFFGHGTILDLVDVIRKNKAEKFLLPASDAHKEQIVDFLEDVKITFTKAIFYKTVSADLSDLKSLSDFDVIVFFTPVGIKSLKHNFPDFKQGNTRIAAFGHSAAQTLKNLGYRLDIYAPNPKNPSMTGALEDYIREANKR